MHSKRKRWTLTILIILMSTPFLCQCYVYKAHKTLKQVRIEIREEYKTWMDSDAQYHLDAAKGLLEAAEKQYEDADFTEATALALQAQNHVDRARKLQQFHELLGTPKVGGTE